MDKLAICEGCEMYIETDNCDDCRQKDCALVVTNWHCPCIFSPSCRRAYEAGRADEKARQIEQVEQAFEIKDEGAMTE